MLCAPAADSLPVAPPAHCLPFSEPKKRTSRCQSSAASPTGSVARSISKSRRPDIQFFVEASATNLLAFSSFAPSVNSRYGRCCGGRIFSVSIGISYVLAGSEAFAALLHIRHIYVIPAFTWILTLAILLAHTVVQPITSLLTLLKGILLIVTVVVTFAVGSEVGLQSSSDFSQMGKPFLMGTVALGGIVNVMPLLFSHISHNKTQILWFRRAVLGGLATCTVLNILWCWAVLEIVPQTSLPEKRTAPPTSAQPTSTPPLLFSNISLEQ
ncbi:uncharacterized protein LOC119776876 [Cyprinodon tularosa]|uniref:uncharacterized protein LOC119776876 n=1 Tax=Cyprinodon tularosa TaxID=77115 RepID=UPI0018E27A02|nr:uncharacterized protein LOC119776876 [Cyprinodon tularosa]